MSKLRLDYFLSLGLKLVDGDEVNHDGRLKLGSSKQAESYNSTRDYDCSIHVTSLAPRKNGGVQPCGDDVPVVVNFNDYSVSSCGSSANRLEWKICHACSDIYLWKPDLDALIKMQIEHDAKQSKPFLQTGEAFEHTKTLNFILSRMINVHGEHESVDYIHKLRNAIIFTEKMESPKQKIELPKPIKPRTKTEHVKIDGVSIFSLSDAFRNNELYAGTDSYSAIETEGDLCDVWSDGYLYRKVETEITWKDAAKELLFSQAYCEGDDLFSLFDNPQDTIEFCHLVASMTDKPG